MKTLTMIVNESTGYPATSNVFDLEENFSLKEFSQEVSNLVNGFKSPTDVFTEIETGNFDSVVSILNQYGYQLCDLILVSNR